MGSRWTCNLSCCGARGRACESAGRRKGRIRGSRTKKEEEPTVGVGIEVGRKGGREKSSARWEGTQFLYPARVAAGPCTRLARCGGSRFPDAGLPPHILLYIINLWLRNS